MKVLTMGGISVRYLGLILSIGSISGSLYFSRQWCSSDWPFVQTHGIFGAGPWLLVAPILYEWLWTLSSQLDGLLLPTSHGSGHCTTPED